MRHTHALFSVDLNRRRTGNMPFITAPAADVVQTQMGRPRALPSLMLSMGNNGGSDLTRKATRFAAYPFTTTRMKRDQPKRSKWPGKVRGAGPPPPVKSRRAQKQAAIAL